MRVAEAHGGSPDLITILTGPSTAGKSTLCRALIKSAALPNLTVTEVDDEQPPEAGTDYWRRYRIELLLHEAVERRAPSLISGALWPHEVLASESYDPDRMQFLILIPSPRMMTKRLGNRLADADADDAAALLRVNRRLVDALSRQGRGISNATILNTTGMSRRRVAATVTNHLAGGDPL